MSQASVLGSMFGGFGGGGSGDPSERAYYQARLKQYLKDQEEEANLADSRQYASLGSVLDEMAGRPDLNNAQKAELALAKAMSTRQFRTDAGVKSIADVIKTLGDDTGEAGKPTNDMKNYLLYEEQTPVEQRMPFEEWQTRFDGNKPATLQIADALVAANPNMSRQDAIMEAGKIKDPERLRVEAEIKRDANIEQERASDENKSVLKKIEALPSAILGMDQAIKNSENVLGKLDKLDEILGRNPNAAGWLEALKMVPETEQREVKNLITTIQANNVINALAQAKASSPTGASGFGSLTEKEGDLLGGQIAKLDQGASIPEIQQAIADIRNFYNERRKMAFEGWKKDYDWNDGVKQYFPKMAIEMRPAPEYSEWRNPARGPSREEMIQLLRSRQQR